VYEKLRNDPAGTVSGPPVQLAVAFAVDATHESAVSENGPATEVALRTVIVIPLMLEYTSICGMVHAVGK
jgi:hypothetical protein